MVEQTRRPSRVVSLQAGPGQVDTGPVFGADRRISDRTARVLARQLAAVGDQLDREWTNRRPNRLPTPLHVLRPAQALTRSMCRDVQGLSAAVKAWAVTTVPGQGYSRAEAWTAWASSLKLLTCTDWTRGGLMTAALAAAAVTLVSASWMGWRD